MEEQIPVLEEQPPLEVPDITEEEGETEIAPTRNIKNFWQRLDDVFSLSVQNAKSQEMFQELLQELENTLPTRQLPYRSFLFQPERLCVSSSDDLNAPTFNIGSTNFGQPPYIVNGGPYPQQYFSEFRVRLNRPLINVKSVQLISAQIPNITQNIPNYALGFYYYRIRSLDNSQLPSWSANTPYFASDIVYYDNSGIAYYAIAGSQGLPPPSNPTKWTAVPTWNNATAYVVGNYVYYAVTKRYYKCLIPNTNVVPTTAGTWLKLGSYDPLVVYNQNDIAYVAGTGYFVCLANNIIGQNPPASGNWKFTSADGTSPNYYDIDYSSLNVIYLNATNGLTYDNLQDGTYNRTFTSYEDLLDALNEAAGTVANCEGNAGINQVEFIYNETLNKFQVKFLFPALSTDFYYFPAGYADKNITDFVANIVQNQTFKSNYVPEYNMNLRLGFTWNGLFNTAQTVDPYSTALNSCYDSLYWFMRPPEIRVAAPLYAINTTTVTANSYGDLVYTGTLRVYCDIVLGSTQDTTKSENADQSGLLSIVPLNVQNNGVIYYQTSFNNPLTKIPKNILEMNFRLVDDQSQPFFLPNSATVLMELGITYF